MLIEKLERRLESSPAICCIVILAATCAAYAGVRSAGFVYDDLLLIQQNPSIRSFANLGDWISRSFWRDVYNPADADHVPYYRPLMTAALAAGHRLSGDEPLGYHLLALALHAASTTWVFVLARRWFGVLAACAAAAAFGLFPVHVEAVAWISGLAEPLAATLGFAGAWCALRAADRLDADPPARGKPFGRLIGAAILSCAAYFSKETAVTIPAVAACIDLLHSPSRARRRFAAWIPAAAALIPYIAMRVAVFGSSAGLGIRQTEFHLPAWRTAVLPFELFASYLETLFWPFDLCAFRVLRVDLSPSSPEILAAIAATAAVILATAALAWTARRRAGARTALALALGTMLPILPFVVRPSSLGFIIFGERFLYVPSAAFCMAIGAAAAWALRRAWPLAAPGLLALLGAYAWRTADRTAVWKDELTLYTVSAKESPDSATVRRELGRLAWNDYQRSGSKDDVDRAFEYFKSAVDQPLRARVFVGSDDVIQAQLGLAGCHLARGWREGALSVAEQVLEIYPRTAEAANLAGVAADSLGNSEAAERYFMQAISIRPTFADAHYNLGNYYFRRDEFARAALEFRSCAVIQPTHVDAQLGLASALFNQKDYEQAAAVLDRVIEIAPNHPGALRAMEALKPLRK